ncbi:MAG: molybdenum cofactor guanylyltransferase MobA [Comamonas sp.]
MPPLPTLQPSAIPHPNVTDVTGVVLAGGQGLRLGGADKGLQLLHGEPLARIVLRRLARQTGRVAINANRNLERYRALLPEVCPEVWPDDGFDPLAPVHAGPLAGLLTALRRSPTPWVQLVACDTPFFPADLVARLRGALADGPDDAGLAIPATRDAHGAWRHHPTMAQVHTGLHDALAAYLAGGERKVMRWVETLPHAVVAFDDAQAFANLNTRADLDAAAATAHRPD